MLFKKKHVNMSFVLRLHDWPLSGTGPQGVCLCAMWACEVARSNFQGVVPARDGCGPLPMDTFIISLILVAGQRSLSFCVAVWSLFTVFC